MRYTILGATEAQDEQGATVASGGTRLRALLTALALRPGRTVGTETLIDEVWNEDPPHDAVAALQALVGRLRRALGKDAVASAAGGYRLVAEPEDVDLFRFERLVREGTAALDRGDPAAAAGTLREALALWRGRALSDLPDRAAATRPEAQRLEATRTRVEADLRLGRAADLVPELKELTAAHPYDEPLHALLIRALRAVGRGADALSAYERVRRILADGLGTEPGSELRALYAELLAPGPGRGPVSAPGGAPVPDGEVRGEAVNRARTSGASRALGGSGGSGGSVLGRGPDAYQGPGERRAEHVGGGEHPGGADRVRRVGNLRRRLTSFVGREPELDAIRADLRTARLVTLTGPGGSGKTRLAEEAAAGISTGFSTGLSTGSSGAWLAELAPLDRPEAVPGAVVSALGLRETALMTSDLSTLQDDPVALLVEYCAQRTLLLILDNCEHVIGAAAELAETLLTRCPGLTVLATSREPLGVPGESVRPVEPLPPDSAHRLFTERARAVRPGFDAAGEADAVDEICRRLDGLPLAIELAAARLRLLTPRQIAERLDDRFRLLTSGSRTALPRQQTLRAVVDWSWDLLDEQERTVLCEVSVFGGGWDLAAAEAVCTGPPADVIGALVDKSLVVATPVDGPQGDGMRYRMLETITEYATERAAERPDVRAAAERRHSAYFGELVATADPLLRSAEQLPWIRRLETEMDNIRAAIRRVVLAGDQESACALALGMGWFWWLRNYRTEGVRWLEYVLRSGPGTPPCVDPPCVEPGDVEPGDVDPRGFDPSAAPDTVFPDADLEAEDHPQYWERMKLRLMHGFLMAELRPAEFLESERSRAHITRLRNVFAQPGPAAAHFPGLIWPFTVFFLEGPDRVRPALDSAVANCRRFGGDWEVAVTLMFRTHMLVDLSGGMKGVDEDLAELRELSGRSGDRWIMAQVSSAAGEAAMSRGLFDEAKTAYGEALRLAYEVGAFAEAPFLIARLAEIAHRSGDRALAKKSLDEATEAADRYGVADSRAFVLVLRAQVALDEGDTAGARALSDAAHEESARGTPPPQFSAALRALDARVSAAESGPAEGLKELAAALYEALESRCAEAVTGGLLDSAAALLSEVGDHRRAARLQSTATEWRGGHARPGHEHVVAEGVEADALAALGPECYEAERAAGAGLTPDGALAELAEATGTEPPRPLKDDLQPWLRNAST